MAVAFGALVGAGPRFGGGHQFGQRSQQPRDAPRDGTHFEESLQCVEVPLEERRDAEGEPGRVPGQLDVEALVEQRVLRERITLSQHVQPRDLIAGGNLNLGFVVEPLHGTLEIRRHGFDRGAKLETPLAADDDVHSAVRELLHAAESGDRPHRPGLGKLCGVAGGKQPELTVLGLPDGQVSEELTIPGFEDMERKQRAGEENNSERK